VSRRIRGQSCGLTEPAVADRTPLRHETTVAAKALHAVLGIDDERNTEEPCCVRMATANQLRGWGRRQPAALAANAAGHVYVAEPTNRRIQQFTWDGEFLALWPARIDVEYSQRLQFPGRIASDVDGRVYVGDYDRVLVLSSDGETLGVWERDEKGRKRFEGLRSISTDGSGQIYLLLSRSVIALKRDGTEVWRVEGPRSGPRLVAADRRGHVNVIDGRDGRIGIRVRVLSRSGTDVRTWRVNAPADNMKAAFDREGRLLVSDWRGCTVRLFATTGKQLAEWGGCGRSDGQFEDISAIAVDPAGNVYVSDYALNRVQVFRLTEAP
jgi:DNA-binding beta-propeller fold protein YncE